MAGGGVDGLCLFLRGLVARGWWHVAREEVSTQRRGGAEARREGGERNGQWTADGGERDGGRVDGAGVGGAGF
jgi:hypothetical protein